MRILTSAILAMMLSCSSVKQDAPKYKSLDVALNVQIFDVTSGMQFSGSAVSVMYHNKQCFLTAMHVISKHSLDNKQYFNKVCIFSLNNQPSFKQIKMIKCDTDQDLALFQIEGGLNLKCVKVSQKPLFYGQKVYNFSNMQGKLNILTQGVVSKPKHIIDGKEYFLTDCMIYAGSSGSGIYDSQTDQLLGIVNMMSNGSHVGLCITNTKIIQFLK